MVSQDTEQSTLAAFNAAPTEAAERDLLACCASRSFATAIAGGRPYPDPAALQAAVVAAFGALSWDDILESMNAHPRIGDRAPAGGWSAAEQSGAASASDRVRQALAEGNRVYERRFGHVFLICASGLSGQDMLDQLRARLGNDADAERAVVRQELLKITQLRLTKLLSLLTVSTLSTHVLDATTGRPATGVRVRLEQNGRDGWSEVCTGLTDADGRLKLPGPAAEAGFEPGVYRITFGSGAYFAARETASFYPEVTVTFEMTGDGGHYHVPLLLSPFAYSTYRGS